MDTRLTGEAEKSSGKNLREPANVTFSLREWIHLAVRWFHVFAGIMWVGQTYYFTWLDGQFGKLEKEVAAAKTPPAVWMVHSGGVLCRRKKEFPWGLARVGPLVSLGSSNDVGQRNGAACPRLLLYRRTS